MPRQTPSTGTSACSSTSRPTEKSFASSGLPGPGESTTWLKPWPSRVSALTSSCSTTVGSSPVTAATRCTRFHVYESWWSTTTTRAPGMAVTLPPGLQQADQPHRVVRRVALQVVVEVDEDVEPVRRPAPALRGPLPQRGLGVAAGVELLVPVQPDVDEVGGDPLD